MEPLLARLGRGELLLADGALGTELIARGLRPGQAPESFNLERPEIVREIAAGYLAAGAELLTTNSFGGTPLKLRAFGLDERTEAVNRRAVEIVREVAGDRAYVSASIGPTGALLKPYGEVDEEVVHDAFARQASALGAAGPDLFCIETMTDLREAELALRAVRAVAPGIPVIVTMTFDPTPRGYFTIMGVDVRRAAEALERAGADGIGSNCGNGTARMVEIATALRSHTRLPLLIQPNAGVPESRGGEVVYPETPAEMARAAQPLVELPVSVLGGCCGTTPQHIRALRELIDGRERPPTS